MNNHYIIYKDEFPTLLKEINDPPEKLNVIGKLPNKGSKILCIVGSRRHSRYGEEACRKLIAGLKNYNICIVSGMALGIDTIAHKSAIENNLQTIAFPGSGLNKEIIYPYQNKKLAEEIINSGGALISEFEMNQSGALWTFPKRNRLMAGISHAVLIVEAELISGTLITSRLATEYNRDVGAVPGQIFSSLSAGPNMLISKGAKTIISSEDVLEMLGLNIKEEVNQKNLFENITDEEKRIIKLLEIEQYTGEELISKTDLSIRNFNQIISSLEIKDLIEENNNGFKLK